MIDVHLSTLSQQKEKEKKKNMWEAGGARQSVAKQHCEVVAEFECDFSDDISVIQNKISRH